MIFRSSSSTVSCTTGRTCSTSSATAASNLLPYDMKVVTAGEGVAIVTYDVVLRVPPSEDQGPPPRYQHFSTVWVKQGRRMEDEVSADDGVPLGRLVDSTIVDC